MRKVPKTRNAVPLVGGWRLALARAPAGPRVPEQCGADKQELPGQRVEIPDMAFGIGGNRDPEDLDRDVQQGRRHQHHQRVMLHGEQHHREDRQHQNV